ncbi:hypothetical protein JHW43_002958 [Diplocarpon mali]|nr:hypothetical protein JHW43_002958 [Diplocarpon mali]
MESKLASCRAGLTQPETEGGAGGEERVRGEEKVRGGGEERVAEDTRGRGASLAMQLAPSDRRRDTKAGKGPTTTRSALATASLVAPIHEVIAGLRTPVTQL